MAEAYVGTKFQTIFVRRQPPTVPCASELLAWCQQWAAAGWIAKATGNLSCRTAAGFLITPTGTDPVTLTAADFVEVLGVTEKEVRVAGVREPSSECRMHAGIYAARPDVTAIFHGHYAPALTAPGVAITAREIPYGTPAMATETVAALGTGNFVVMRNHGFVAVGATLRAAHAAATAVLAKL